MNCCKQPAYCQSGESIYPLARDLYTQLKYWAVSSSMYSRMHALGPVSETYILDAQTLDTTLNNKLRYSEIHSCLRKDKTVFQQNSGEKVFCVALSHKTHKDCSGSHGNLKFDVYRYYK